METIEEKLGYLIAKTEEMSADNVRFFEQLDKVDNRLSTLEYTVHDKFKTVELFIKGLKFIGLATVAVLSFQFGDVSRLWTFFFG